MTPNPNPTMEAMKAAQDYVAAIEGTISSNEHGWAIREAFLAGEMHEQRRTNLPALLKAVEVTKALQCDPTGCDEPTCARCHDYVTVKFGMEWDDGDLCNSCIQKTAQDIRSALDALERKE